MEIERKYLVTDNFFLDMAHDHVDIWQGYLSADPMGATVRVRVYGNNGFITIKGPTHGIEREEWEYPIPLDDARAIIQTLCHGKYVNKTRYLLDYEGFRWEIDAFHHPHAGLVVAEVELPDSAIIPPLPPFIGKEVSDDPRYYNSNLVNGEPL